jgi:peptidoglycan L-alanyl-D-glutamate endopeptidase CwlK
MPTFSKQSLGKLATCDQRLQDILNEAIKIVDITVIQGFRNKFDQDAAVASGHSKVNWPNGRHNSLPSRAVDIAPYHMGVGIDWSDLIAFGRMMGVVQAIAHAKGVRLRFGLDWDGDFRSVGPDPDESFLDAPHVELVDP